MFITFKMNGSMGEDVASIRAFYTAFAPFVWIVSFLANSSITGLLLTLAITVLPYALGVFLFSLIFGARQRTWHSNKKSLEFRMRTPLGALYKKEFKRYAASSVYVVNSILGPLMCVALTVLIVIRVSLGAEFNSIFTDPSFVGIMPIIMVVLYSFMPALTITSACSISMEGKTIYSLRSNPIREKDVFLSKILVNLTLSAPVTVIGGLVAGISLGLAPAEVAAMAIIPGLVAVVTAVLGLYINLVFPKLDWDNEAMVVKQSAATMLAMFSGMLVCGIPALVFFALGSALSFGIRAVLCAALLALIIVGLWSLLMSDGKKRYNELY
jgi:ABC-2 type transport system permease protein